MEAKAILVNNNNKTEEDQQLIDLPPGFRFHPTDEEIITCYLMEKVMNSNFSASAIGEADLNKCEPWDLPKKAKMGEKEWYFFCQRDRKYPTGMRTNRATESGYWKATGKDKEIYKGKTTFLVGMKKTLVFYTGRAPKGEKTNWVMHEYRLEGKYSYYNLPKGTKDEWVVCRVFHKNMGIKKTPIQDLMRMNSLENIDNLFDYSSLPPLMDPSYSNTTTTTISSPQGQNSNYHINYFGIGNMNDNYDQPQQNQKINFQLPNSANNSINTNPIQSPNLYSQIQVPNQPYSFQTITPKYLKTNFKGYSSNLIGKSSTKNDHVIEGGQSKMQEFSSNEQTMVSLSQDTTGLSSDMNNTTTTTTTNTEISSVIKQEMASKSYNHQDHSFESFWDDF